MGIEWNVPSKDDYRKPTKVKNTSRGVWSVEPDHSGYALIDIDAQQIVIEKEAVMRWNAPAFAHEAESEVRTYHFRLSKSGVEGDYVMKQIDPEPPEERQGYTHMPIWLSIPLMQIMAYHVNKLIVGDT
jgi:hypothetical protein